MDELDFPLLPFVFRACSGLQTCGQFLHHSQVITCIIAGDVADLCDITNEL